MEKYTILPTRTWTGCVFLRVWVSMQHWRLYRKTANWSRYHDDSLGYGWVLVAETSNILECDKVIRSYEVKGIKRYVPSPPVVVSASNPPYGKVESLLQNVTWQNDPLLFKALNWWWV